MLGSFLDTLNPLGYNVSMPQSSDDISRSIDCIVCNMQFFCSEILRAAVGMVFTIGENFISEIVAFEVGVLAILIPVSLDIVTRVADRYKSDLIAKKILKRFEFKGLPYLLLTSILTTVFFELRKYNSDNSGLLEFCHLFLIISLFIASIIYTWRLVMLVRKYTGTTSETLLDELFRHAEQIIHKESP